MMPPEPGWLGRLIDEHSYERRRARARARLSQRLRAFGYWLKDLENENYGHKFVRRAVHDIPLRIEERKTRLARNKTLVEVAHDLCER